MPRKFIRNLTAKHRTPKTDMQLGITLAFTAGAMNAGGFLAVGYYTSHMSGVVSSIADYIVLNKFASALLALLYLLSFIVGTVISSFIINWTRARQFYSDFALALMLEAFLLLIFGLFAANLPDAAMSSVHITISLLCLIMGLQNAIITKISHAEIRTTHVTGLATDIGIAIGRYLYIHGSDNKEVAVNFAKLRLHSSLLLSFLIGGILGAFSFKNYGFIATIPFSLLLAILASIPILNDYLGHKH